MEYDTPGVRLFKGFYWFIPAIAVAFALALLPGLAKPIALFLNHALFIWAGYCAYYGLGMGEAAKVFRRRFPAQLIVQLFFGLLAGLMIAVPVAMTMQEVAAAPAVILAVSSLLFLVICQRAWPALAMATALPEIGRDGSGPFRSGSDAAFSVRTALEITRGDMDRMLEGVPLVIAAIVANAIPFGMYLWADGLAATTQWAIFAGYSVLFGPLTFGFLVATVDKLVKDTSSVIPSKTQEMKRIESGIAAATEVVRPLETSVSQPQKTSTVSRPRGPTRKYEDPVLQAAVSNELATIKTLVKGPEDLNAEREETTALILAVRRCHDGDTASIDWMIAQGADPDATDAKQRAPLHHAAALGHLEALRALIQAQAKLEVFDKEGYTPLSKACANRNWAAAEVLIDHGAKLESPGGIPALQAAASVDLDDATGVQLLLQRDADANGKGKLQRTALMGAALRGNALIAEELLKADADVNSRDAFGNSALMEAARSGANNVLERFLFWKPETEFRDKPGRTALLVAVSSRRADPETIRLLLAMGADPRVKNREGREAGDLAIANGRWRIAKALGAEKTEQDDTAKPAATQSAKPASTRIVADEDGDTVIDLSLFETSEDRAWAKRQMEKRSRTQLESATVYDNQTADATPDEEAVAEPQTTAKEPAQPEPPAAEAVSEPDQELAADNTPVTSSAKDLESTESTPEEAENQVDSEAEGPKEVQLELSMPEVDDQAIEAPEADESATAADDAEESADSGSSGSIAAESKASAEPADMEPAEDGSDSDAVAARDSVDAPVEDSQTTPKRAVPELNQTVSEAESDAYDAMVAAAQEESTAGATDTAPEARSSASSDGETSGTQAGYRALLDAAQADDISQMEVVLTSESEFPDWWLSSAFLNSVAAGNIIAPKWMLENGLNANAVSESGQPLLECIVQQPAPNPEIIHNLLDAGARIGGESRALIWLSGFSDHQHGQKPGSADEDLEKLLTGCVERMIEAGAQVDATDSTGRTALHWAAQYRGPEYTSTLLDMEATVDSIDDNGDSPLILACKTRSSHQMAIVRLLVQRGAIAKLKNSAGESPLALGMKSGNQTLLKMLMMAKGDKPAMPTEKAGPEELIDAAAEGNLGRIKRLLNKGANVNHRDSRGCTAVLRAAGAGHPTIVTSLIAAGADINLPANNGTTPLGAAVMGNHREIVRLLVERGANVDQAQQFGITPLMLAAARWHARMVSLLLRLGADVNARDDAEGTALMAAVQNALVSTDTEAAAATVKLLVEADADVNAKNDEGQTPLMLLLGVRARRTDGAQSETLVRLTRSLIDGGADMNSQDLTGWSALHAAAAHGFIEPAEVMVKAGANRRLRDINGLSPCDLAMDNAHDHMVDLFIGNQ